MKQSEFDKLRELIAHYTIRGTYQAAVKVVDDLTKWLETVEVDHPSAKEIKQKLGWTGPEHEPEEAFK